MDNHPNIPDGEVTGLRDHWMIDVDGEAVGKIRDVLFDGAGHPSWAVVATGPLGRAHYVPVNDAYNSDQGRLVVAYRKDTIRRSPKAGRDHVLDPVLERDLLSHYGAAA